ncbi:MAG: methylenetetrahydrofolate--tRNA-(uracil(54)-C(5))-methyltransferase (FADH(2)-oxidizing) TrmFO [Oscillospiraceae bacterium]
MKATVIGAGLAGCEAAYILANNNVEVTLYEMKPQKYTKAHTYQGFAELVCSNSLKAMRVESAAGLLKAEMQKFGSLCVKSAYSCNVPAGGALAVDRTLFSDYITNAVKSHKNIKVVTDEIEEIPDGNVIIATGPLTSDALSKSIEKLLNSESLSFYDAAAPIVTAESIDMNSAFKASRYDKGDDDYINCPMEKDEYLNFYNELLNAEIAPLSKLDKMRVYEGCMPIEVMAKRGQDTMRFGPLKPVGLTNPHTGKRPYAVVQLRNENSSGTMYNLVGFQTNLKFPEQKRVFSLIPALKNAEFVRYGVMHRNTFIDSPRVLNSTYNLKSNENIFFAGQITGVEGYMESAQSGIMAGLNMLLKLQEKEMITLPNTTMMGALARYISDDSVKNFQPMGSNMGILPTVDIRDKKERYKAVSQKAIDDLQESIQNIDFVTE